MTKRFEFISRRDALINALTTSNENYCYYTKPVKYSLVFGPASTAKLPVRKQTPSMHASLCQKQH